MEHIAVGAVCIYKGKAYRIVEVASNILLQDKEMGNWSPAVYYSNIGNKGLIFGRAQSEFMRKFKYVGHLD